MHSFQSQHVKLLWPSQIALQGLIPFCNSLLPNLPHNDTSSAVLLIIYHNIGNNSAVLMQDPVNRRELRPQQQHVVLCKGKDDKPSIAQLPVGS